MDARLRQLVETSSDVVLRTHVEPADTMVQERARASVNSDSLAAFMNGGTDNLNRKCVLRATLAMDRPLCVGLKNSPPYVWVPSHCFCAHRYWVHKALRITHESMNVKGSGSAGHDNSHTTISKLYIDLP